MPITTAPTAGRPTNSNGEFSTGLFDCCGDVGSCAKDCYQKYRLENLFLFCVLKSRNDSNYKSYCCPCLVAKDVATHIGDNGTAWCLMYLMGLICTGWVSS